MTQNNSYRDDILDTSHRNPSMITKRNLRKEFSWIQVLIMKLRKYASIERDGYFQIYDKDGELHLPDTIHR